jgi:hypothetical protein
MKNNNHGTKSFADSVVLPDHDGYGHQILGAYAMFAMHILYSINQALYHIDP